MRDPGSGGCLGDSSRRDCAAASEMILAVERLARGDDSVATVGRITATSGSLPTMMVSVWWRAWLQRQTVGSRMIMKQDS